jgi:hypothetical protein
MMGPEEPKVFIIVLQPIPGNNRLPPPIVRLRLLLKRALRDWRLKCISVREEEATPGKESIKQ